MQLDVAYEPSASPRAGDWLVVQLDPSGQDCAASLTLLPVDAWQALPPVQTHGNGSAWLIAVTGARAASGRAGMVGEGWRGVSGDWEKGKTRRAASGGPLTDPAEQATG